MSGPKDTPPVSDGLNKANEFSFVDHQLGVVRRELPAEEGNQPHAVM
jgi:hypothetical protein